MTKPKMVLVTDAEEIRAIVEDEGHLDTVPSIHMPRWASRITLKITDVRVERLQDISEDDAKSEGAAFMCDQCGNDLDNENGAEVHAACDREYDDGASRKIGFRRIWVSINGADSWSNNPWVWVLRFEIDG